MALSTATISFDLSGQTGIDYDRRRGIRGWIDTNIPGDTVVDTTGNKIRLGDGKVTINDDGTGSFTVWTPGAGSNPASWQTYFHVQYVPQGDPQKGRQTRTFGPFTITGNADLADLIAEQEVPPTYLSAVTAQLDAKVDEADASATSAAAWATQAQEVALGDAEAVLAGAMVNPGPVKDNLTATIAAEVAAPGIPARQSVALGSRLALWQSALANCSAAPADVVVIGDSISEGAWAGYNTRWIDRLRDTLRARYQPTGVTGGRGYVPIRNIGGWAASPWVTTGAGVIDVNQGLGDRGVAITDETTTVALTFTGTGVDVFYTGTPGSGNLEVKIDGGTVATVATIDPSQGSGHVWSSGTLTAGSHTVTLRSAGSGWVWPEGAMVYNGDRAAGVRVWDASHFGFTIADFNNTIAGWGGSLASVNPDLVLLAAGRNDWSAGASLSTYTTRLQLLHDYAEIKAPNASIAFVIEHATTPGGTPAAPWADFVAAIYDLAETNDRAVIDMTRFGGAASAAAAPLSLLHSDQVHPLAKGHAWYAQAVASALAP